MFGSKATKEAVVSVLDDMLKQADTVTDDALKALPRMPAIPVDPAARMPKSWVEVIGAQLEPGQVVAVAGMDPQTDLRRLFDSVDGVNPNQQVSGFKPVGAHAPQVLPEGVPANGKLPDGVRYVEWQDPFTQQTQTGYKISDLDMGFVVNNGKIVSNDAFNLGVNGMPSLKDELNSALREELAGQLGRTIPVEETFLPIQHGPKANGVKLHLDKGTDTMNEAVVMIDSSGTIVGHGTLEQMLDQFASGWRSQLDGW